ncbi:MAG TPA: hypothetical protein VGY99_08410 [Candidatus Binataceae bacterium]|jgi:hypothetical protein|nr:hypothetical protein [Candidatus Binataceae bacterium]
MMRSITKLTRTTGFFLAVILSLTLLSAGTAGAQACGGFCSALQTAYGNLALNGNGGVEKTAVGDNALGGNTGNDNTGVGVFSLLNSTGNNNTAIGVTP